MDWYNPTDGLPSHTMAHRRMTDAEILAQIPAAREREKDERRRGLRALSARFDASARRVELELSNGMLFAFPVQLIRALERLSPSELRKVSVDSSGGALRWEDRDIDLSVPGLLLASVGEVDRRRYLARLAGSTRSRSKAAAARANGALGGRPRSRGPKTPKGK